MKLSAKRYQQKVSADLQYKNGAPSVRRYDSCYYEITPDANAMSNLNALGIKNNTIMLKLQITKALQMNIFVYGGLNR